MALVPSPAPSPPRFSLSGSSIHAILIIILTWKKKSLQKLLDVEEHGWQCFYTGYYKSHRYSTW